MRYYLFVITGLFFLKILPVYAQGEPRFGVWGGLNLAYLHIDGLNEIIDFNSRTVLGVGGQLEIDLSRHFVIQFQAGYLQKGTKFKDLFEAIPPEVELKMNYIELPALFKYKLRPKGIQPHLLVGQSIGYLLNARFVRASRGRDFKDDLKRFDFSLVFGAGVGFPITSKVIFFELRYSVGMVNINDNQNEPDTRTRGLQFITGITL